MTQAASANASTLTHLADLTTPNPPSTIPSKRQCTRTEPNCVSFSMEYPQKSPGPRAKKFESVYQGRLRQFTARQGEYADLNLAHYLDRQRENRIEYVDLRVFSVPGCKRPSFEEAMDLAANKWKPARVGDVFGPSWTTHWFRIEVLIPLEWKTAVETPVFDFDSSDEGFYYTESGEPRQGLSGEHGRTEILLNKAWIDGARHCFYIETSCNDITGVGTPADPNRQFRLNRADLVLPNAGARALDLDFSVLSELARDLPSDAWQRMRALDTCNRIINAFDRTHVDDSLKTCRKLARTAFGNVDTPDVYEVRGEEVDYEPMYTDVAEFSSSAVFCIGNCHIDTAWLWPFAETRRKVARSWSTQLDLIEKYPEYVFVASQAVQFQWLKEDHPNLFKRVQKAVEAGRFIPIGGSWVECDTNMPSGESLTRQLCLGQQFFEREFKTRSQIFWLPDTFGYAPQVPQICRSVGMPFFLTQKLSWNDIDKFPMSTFNWVGLDRSQVVCHMPPLNTYTAMASASDVLKSSQWNRSQDVAPQSMLLYGFGDGGGGPTSTMIEKLRRCRGVSNESHALPTVVSGPRYSPLHFYKSVLASTNNGADLPTWYGEMYLEYHRGTYTTQAAIKAGNRRCEELLRLLEAVATRESLVRGVEYPFAEIEKLWQDVCLNQFHDVLPGSGITMIYEDARKIHQRVLEEGNNLLDRIFNSIGCERGAVEADDFPITAYWMSDEFGRDNFRLNEILASVSPLVDENNCEFGVSDLIVLDNPNFRVEFLNGELVSVQDKREGEDFRKRPREALAGIGNQFVLYEDQPQNFYAWDTEQYSYEKKQVLKPCSWSQGGNDYMQLMYKFGKSSIQQTVYLRTNSIEFHTEVDWHETYQFLKVEFPVAVMNDFASYDTAFGVQHRPTHLNTSWDASKFEVCAHRFADLSQRDFGVALLSDSKYGYSVQGSTMRLSLLRAPKNPDPTADMGVHRFCYALAPHEHELSPKILQIAEELNCAHATFNMVDEGLYNSQKDSRLLESDPEDTSVRLSSLKRAFADAFDPSRKCAVVRLYEALGGAEEYELHLSKVPFAAFETNALEDMSSAVELKLKRDMYGVFYTLEFSPFEVKTILLYYSDPNGIKPEVDSDEYSIKPEIV